jgi:hypothetical protein
MTPRSIVHVCDSLLRREKREYMLCRIHYRMSCSWKDRDVKLMKVFPCRVAIFSVS